MPKQIKDPQLQSLRRYNIYSEASALFFAYNSSIINEVMNSNKINFAVNGRMRSAEFSFTVKNILHLENPTQINVKNSQIEIDAGFESPEAFLDCEAKNQAPNELMIRRLYYHTGSGAGKYQSLSSQLC
ncbi:MAG: hypothetical protein LBE38_01635 [Deltaproteobacteria bacterium]|jgi:hypothetical protein|nr:hypothetical protein [Deltaproteobacteria bacterium]